MLWLLLTEVLPSMGLGEILIHRQKVQFGKECGGAEIERLEKYRDSPVAPLGFPALRSPNLGRLRKQEAASLRMPTLPGPQLGTLRAPYNATAGAQASRSPDDGWLYRAPGVRHPLASL